MLHSILLGISPLSVQFGYKEGILFEQMNGDFKDAANLTDTGPPISSSVIGCSSPWSLKFVNFISRLPVA